MVARKTGPSRRGMGRCLEVACQIREMGSPVRWHYGRSTVALPIVAGMLETFSLMERVGGGYPYVVLTGMAANRAIIVCR